MPETVIEPVRRSFAVLEALSRRRSATLSMLASETALPRPTVVRLLKTLIALGYAMRVSRQQGYRLTDRVLRLSESIRFIDHLVDTAIPHMTRFTAEHGWPLYLATLSQGAITIRHSTATESPMAFEGAALNSPRPMLISALGRAWLAFCSDEERRTVLRDIGVRLSPALAATFARIRRDGHAFTALPKPGRLQGIAVPIRQGPVRQGGRVLGSVSMRFTRSALTDAQAGARYGPLLTKLAQAIAHDVP